MCVVGLGSASWCARDGPADTAGTATDAGARLCLTFAGRPAPACAETGTRWPAGNAAEKPAKRQGPIRPVGGGHRDRSKPDAGRFGKAVQWRRAVRSRAHEPRTPAHCRRQGHHRLCLGTRCETPAGAGGRRSVGGRPRWQRHAPDPDTGNRDRCQAEPQGRLCQLRARRPFVRASLGRRRRARSGRGKHAEGELGRCRVHRAGRAGPVRRSLVGT